MPRSSNAQGDLSNLSINNPVADKDNAYFSDQGWVYRHYKNAAKTEYWDEILVAGQALNANGTDATGTTQDFGVASPTFLVGDTEGTPPSTGAVLSFSLTTGGVGYAAETTAAQASVAPTGGTGVTFDITVDSGEVATLALTDAGSGYSVGDVITLAGGTTGATVTVNAVAA